MRTACANISSPAPGLTTVVLEMLEFARAGHCARSARAPLAPAGALSVLAARGVCTEEVQPVGRLLCQAGCGTGARRRSRRQAAPLLLQHRIEQLAPGQPAGGVSGGGREIVLDTVGVLDVMGALESAAADVEAETIRIEEQACAVRPRLHESVRRNIWGPFAQQSLRNIRGHSSSFADFH